ncbi:uncharacterized protein LOC120126451 [Hibiscus syriacus]|uniref:uncharacterized protein LOC120126451 n=1 Tax=Hibiscus syriacus TaxID=106335 RepID=UPI001924D8FA|nr:uncharacterized protein LOC120126451 [Hibiscus syriacus]
MSSDGIENAISVQTWSEYKQTRFGDSLATTEDTVFPEKVIIRVRQAHWVELSRIWSTWDDNEKTLFRGIYGDIVELLRVPINSVVIRALAECWNPAYRCFTFGKVDMTPTLEEYTTLLNIPNIRRHSIYTKAIRPKGFIAKMITLTGKTKEWVEEYIRDEGISWAQLKSLIYEQTPSKEEEITSHLQYMCRRLGGGQFIGCVSLLLVWWWSHSWIVEKGWARRHQSNFSPLVDFLDKCQIPEHRKRKDWVEALRNMKDTEIVWKAYWLPKEDILFRCGNDSFIMLHGLWGAIGYTPLIVLRQFGTRQFVPATHGLKEAEFSFSTPGYRERISKIYAAWQKPQCMSFKMIEPVFTPAYEVWRSQRINNNTPKPNLEDQLTMEERLRRLPTETELLKEEMRLMNLKREKEQRSFSEEKTIWELEMIKKDGVIKQLAKRKKRSRRILMR